MIHATKVNGLNVDVIGKKDLDGKEIRVSDNLRIYMGWKLGSEVKLAGESYIIKRLRISDIHFIEDTFLMYAYRKNCAEQPYTIIANLESKLFTSNKSKYTTE